MIEFLLRAHGAPTDPHRFLQSAGGDAHVEYLAQTVINTLFISKAHRPDTVLTIVCENSADYSRALTLSGDRMGDMGTITEVGILGLLAEALGQAQGLGKEMALISKEGIRVQAISFERLVKERLARGEVFLLDRKGQDIRTATLPPDPTFLLTDHVPLPRNLKKSLLRQGVKPLALGPVMLHASQCVVLVQNEHDRLYSAI